MGLFWRTTASRWSFPKKKNGPYGELLFLLMKKEPTVSYEESSQLKMNSRHVGVALTRRRRDPVGGLFTWGSRQISCLGRSNWRCWICTQMRFGLVCWLPRLPLAHTSAGVTNSAGCLAHTARPRSWSNRPLKIGTVLTAQLRRQDHCHSSALVSTLVRLTWSLLSILTPLS